MCAPKSAIVFKGMSVYCPLDTDSHSDMLEQKGIRDESPFPTFVKVEIYPDDKNLFQRDYDRWILHEDQDEIPEWYDHEKAQDLLREEVRRWHEKRFIFGGQTVEEIVGGRWYMHGGTLEDMCGGTLEDMWDGTLQNMRGGTLQNMWGGTLQDMWDGCLKNHRGGIYVAGKTIYVAHGSSFTLKESPEPQKE